MRIGVCNFCYLHLAYHKNFYVKERNNEQI